MKVFLTGATGHLGGELLVALSAQPDVERVHCLVRARRACSVEERMASVFALHADSFDRRKVRSVEGDLLDRDLASRLAANELRDIDVVVHCAAETSFSPFKSALVESTNVRGTERLLAWAARLPSLATFAFVGTAAIRGADAQGRVIEEDESPTRERRHLVHYTRSKWNAELLLPRHLREDRILVVRPSILLGDSLGRVPRSVDVLWAMAVINALRLIPVDPRLPLDIVPADYAARAILALLRGPRRHRTYHVSAGIDSATCATRLAHLLEARYPELPPFRFVEPRLRRDLARWLRVPSRIPPSLLAHADYLAHWSSLVPDRAPLSAIFSAVSPYFDFMLLGQVFDNRRLLADTAVPRPPPAHDYLPASLDYVRRIDLAAGAAA